MTSAISMAFALDLHRELPLALKVSQGEREGRRRLFWSCYLMDRFAAAGSKRPSLIADEAIVLRLPSWQLHPGGMLLEGDYFPNGSNLQYMAGGRAGQGSMGMLIGIAKVLGITNRYLAAGGVRGHSHFPWHSLSNLSKIRQELYIWASETQDTFTSIDALFGQPDSTILVLSKLVYHLIHCLIYRPFLPVDLAELSGSSQHQSWQIEATNLCFLHANAIAELVEIGSAFSIIDWPAPEFLSREMHQLSELRFVWASVTHQRETLQNLYGCHTELVKSLATNPMRFSSVFQLEDFFDRYPGHVFDGSHVIFTDIPVEIARESLPAYNVDQRANVCMNTGMGNQNVYHPSPIVPSSNTHSSGHLNKKRRSNTMSSVKGSSQAVPAPLPTPTSATHPLHSDARPGGNEPAGNRARSPASAPSFSPPPRNNSTNGAQNHNLNLPFSLNFTFSPLPPIPSLAPTPNPGQTQAHPPPPQPHDSSHSAFDPMLSMPTPYDQQATPGAVSTSGGSVHTDPDKDPFLSLLEQLAENEVSRGGPWSWITS
ncbi:hypothetical protein PMIN03_012622 [Paraphaeosphaeria minitans]